MRGDYTGIFIHFLEMALWVGGVFSAILLARRIYSLPALRTWARCAGYTMLEHSPRLGTRDYRKFEGVTLPIDWPWKYFTIKVADKSGKQREGVIYLGRKEVWVFWLDQGFADRLTWAELLKSKGAQADELLA